MNEYEENSFTGGDYEQSVRFPDTLPEEDFSLVHVLQKTYRSHAENNARSLERVWSHIASGEEYVQDGHQTAFPDDVRINALPPSHALGPLPIRIGSPRRRQQMAARAQTLVAALVVVALLGAFLALFATHDKGSLSSHGKGSGNQQIFPLPSCGAWSIVSSPSPGSAHNQLNSVAAVSANDMWAVGGFSSTVNGPFQPLIEHWNGSFWSVVENPELQDVSLRQMAVVSANNILAVGEYTIGGASQPLIEHWNGSSWSVVKSPLLPSGQNSLSSLNSVVVVSPSDIWAVGYFFLEPPAFKLQTLIEHWNGSSWSIVKSPNPWPHNNELDKVTALSANNIWAVGIYNSDGAVTKPLIEHWNGSSWSVVTSPSVKNTYLADVVRVPHTGIIWAVGSSFSKFGSNSWQTFAEVYC